MLRTEADIHRTAVVDPSICDIVHFTPREVLLIGRGEGATHVTFWFRDSAQRPATYLVRILPDPEPVKRREEQIAHLEQTLAELFPENKIRLLLVGNKLVVKGQCRDAAAAAHILAVLRNNGAASGETTGGPKVRPKAKPAKAPKDADSARVLAVIPVSELAGVRPVSQCELIDDSDEVQVRLRCTKLVRTKADIVRTVVVDPAVCEVVQFTPRKVSIAGKSQGATHVSFWFGQDDSEPVTYLVRVMPDAQIERRLKDMYRILGEELDQLFPNSRVEVIPVEDKVIIKGWAQDEKEAARIMSIGRHIVNDKKTYLLARQVAGRSLPIRSVVDMVRYPKREY
jgi:Flp pilus assembly secretin CpaC